MSEKVKIILAFCLSVFILGVIGVFAYINTNDYRSATNWVNHSQQVISQTQKLLSEIQDIESAQRGYVITGNEKYLEPYKDGLKTIKNTHLLLNDLIKDDRNQQVLLDSIYSKITLKINFTKKVVSIRHKEGFMNAQQLVSTDLGKNLMKEIRVLTHNFINTENQLLLARLVNAKQKFSSTVTIIIASIILTIFIVLTTMYFFIQDYNKIIRSKKQLSEQEEQNRKLAEFQNIILNTTDYSVISTTDPDGIISSFNKGAEKMLGYKSEEVVGKTSPAIFHDSDEVTAHAKILTEELKTLVLPGVDVFHIKSRLGHSPDINEWTYIRKDGSRITVELSVTTLKNKENFIIGYLGIAKDITEQKKAKNELIKARQIAEESAVLKEAFLANMSHEIRTPMNAIIGFTDLLLKRNLGEKENDFVQTIKASGENLLRIINDVLDVSKIESGSMNFEESPLSVKDIFISLNIMLSQKATEKKLNLSFECENDVPDVVLGDPVRLSQVIINLVGNAIKFTKKGSVDVFAKVVSEENEIVQIEFSVKDTGIGIPEDKFQHIFERFRQAESHTTRNYGGTGLGLSIAKQLVELQGGLLTVKSMEGIGSIFSFTLPFTKSKETYITPDKKNYDFNIQDISKLNILVAEDNPINIKFILSLFSDYNINADVVENGKQAVEKIKNKQYDLVLMDIEMPIMNGYEATAVIRNDLKNNIPIIAMTAHAMAGEKEKCLQLGMNDFISKPIRADVLFEKMIIATTKTDNKKGRDQKNKIINLDFLVESMLGKKEVILEMLDIFLKQIPEYLAEINEAITKADYATIKQISHRMKSTVYVMGISTLNPVLEEMETLAGTENALSTDKQGIEKIKILYDELNKICNQAIKEVEIEKNNA